MWAVVDSIEPIGGRRDDLLAAHWMQTFVNMHRDVKKQREPYPLSDFILVDRLKAIVVDDPAKDDKSEGAKISLDTIAFLISESRKAGYMGEF